MEKIIREYAEKDRIAFKKHSIVRMHQRNILADEVKEVLVVGEIIEIYEHDRPLPSYLVFGTSKSQKIMHAVVAIDRTEMMLWIITVYLPDCREWKKGFKRRIIK